MSFPFRCRCGQVQAQIDLDQAYTRATCYCKDCQAFARFLGDGNTNARGGTDVAPMAPGAVRFTEGFDQVACMSLSPKGLLRWYSACCRSPIGNTGRDAAQYYLGMVLGGVQAPAAEVDKVLGPRERIVLFRKQARGEVKPTPVAFALGGLSIMRHLLGARLRGKRNTTLFDETGVPKREVQVLTLEQRHALQAGNGD